METNLGGHQPVLVFDNHDNERSIDRFADLNNRKYDQTIARLIAAILYTTRSTALTYYGAEIGMTTHTPTRREDVRDPIGITGWPKVKGRDGERTPMQWCPDPPAACFTTNPHPWLPVGADFPTVNVATETPEANSLLNWNRALIAIRRDNPTMHSGGITMLDPTNPSVLSYVRTTPPMTESHSIVVSLNFTDQPQTVHLSLQPAAIPSNRIKVLLADDASLQNLNTLSTFTLPPYATLIAEVQ
jgi:alpha-glucosidase